MAYLSLILTSRSRSGSGLTDAGGPDAFEVEAEAVSLSRNTQRIARWLLKHAIPRDTKGGWLADASPNWDAMFVSGSPPGAMTPDVARNTITRQAHTRRWNAQRARRSGINGLLAAIGAA